MITNKICDCVVITDGVTVDNSTLLLDVPTNVFRNGEKICLVIAQTIPDTATINMPVALTIGGVTTTTYPLVKCDCSPVTASMIRTRHKYPLKVSTTATGATFKVLGGLCCGSSNSLDIIP